MTAALLALIVITVATIRITRIVTIDKISEPARKWIIARNGHQGWWTYLAHCPWCMGVWFAAPAAAIAWWPGHLHNHVALPDYLGVPALWLTIAYVVGWQITQGEEH